MEVLVVSDQSIRRLEPVSCLEAGCKQVLCVLAHLRLLILLGIDSSDSSLQIIVTAWRIFGSVDHLELFDVSLRFGLHLLRLRCARLLSQFLGCRAGVVRWLNFRLNLRGLNQHTGLGTSATHTVVSIGLGWFGLGRNSGGDDLGVVNPGFLFSLALLLLVLLVLLVLVVCSLLAVAEFHVKLKLLSLIR